MLEGEREWVGVDKKKERVQGQIKGIVGAESQAQSRDHRKEVR